MIWALVPYILLFKGLFLIWKFCWFKNIYTSLSLIIYIYIYMKQGAEQGRWVEMGQLIPWLFLKYLICIGKDKIDTQRGKGIRQHSKQTRWSCLCPLSSDDNRKSMGSPQSRREHLWRGRWKADASKLKEVCETNGFDVALLGLHACYIWKYLVPHTQY